ncbi:Adenylate-forming reductase [Paramyrothecium foliicola]|nr:Adenylate-forming reductase [Paramyrothecium foliicola]
MSMEKMDEKTLSPSEKSGSGSKANSVSESTEMAAVSLNSASATQPVTPAEPATLVSGGDGKGYRDLEAAIPDKILSKVNRNIVYRVFIVYRRLFSLVGLLNIGAAIALCTTGLPRDWMSNMVAINLTLAIAMRQEMVVNFLYLITCSVPTSWPLWLRLRCGKIFHFGGVHSGAGVSATIWLLATNLGDVGCTVTGSCSGAWGKLSTATRVISWILTAGLTSMLVTAYPTFRKKYHNAFEQLHRFAGWTMLALFWAQTVLAANDNRADHVSLGTACLRSPPLWLLVFATLCVASSWFWLRKVPVIPEVLSDHAIRLHFKYTIPVNGSFIRISYSPLKEWHSFAPIPAPTPVDDKPAGYSIIVSNAGDWTRRTIQNPPKEIWVRGIPVCGVMHVTRLFSRVVLIATGSGIGPVLGHMHDRVQPMKLIWSTPHPEKTFGQKLCDTIRSKVPDAVIWDTRVLGRPDLVKMGYNMAKSFDAEAVVIIANEPITKKDVEAQCLRRLDLVELRYYDESTPILRIRTPRLYMYDEITKTQVQGYLPGALSLKEYALKNFHASRPETSRPRAHQLGKLLAEYICCFNQIAREESNIMSANDIWPQQKLFATLDTNKDMQNLKHMVNYDWMIQRIDRFPEILGQYKQIFIRAKEQALEELESIPQDLDALHGDWCPANVLLSDTPMEAGKETQILAVDWENAQLGVQSGDHGEMLGEIYALWFYQRKDAGLWLFRGYVEGLRVQTESLAWRIALQTGVHLLAFGTLASEPPEKVQNLARLGGTLHNGSKMTHYGTPSGTIESVPGYEPAFKATVNFGADWLSFDPDGEHGRIDLRGMARTENGSSIDFRYVGVIKMAPEVHKIFDMDPEMATVPFGFATGSHTFTVADPALKDLENNPNYDKAMAPSFDARTTGDELVSHYATELKGKVVLTTGVSPTGLGAVFAESIAKGSPSLLILASRNVAKTQKAADAITAANPDVAVRVLQLDLSSLAAVREAAGVVNGWDDVPQIDILVNNGGIMATDFALSTDGFESQFATNHLGHFLFTNLIIEKILKSASPRIVSVSSDGHRLNPIRWADYNFRDGETYNKWHAYGQSKTANILLAISLAEKLGSKGLLSFSLHPGVIGNTQLGTHLDWNVAFPELNAVDKTLGNAEGWADFKWKTEQEGIATHVFAALAPELKDNNGAYLVDAHIADPLIDTVKPWATSPIEAERLWKLSEELVGQKFSF